MDRSLKRFARRIILVHLVLLLGVLGLVIGASHAVYQSAHNQAVEQSKTQLDLLANLTASGIRGFYDGIFGDLELLKPVNPDSEDTDERTPGGDAIQFRPPPGSPPPPVAVNPRPRRNILRDMPPQIRTLEEALPYQLNGRVSHLFLYPKDGSARVFRKFGPQATKPESQEVATAAADWLEMVEQPAILSLRQVPVKGEEARSFSVIGVPVPGPSRGFVLVATVPVKSTAKRFFDEVNQSGQNAAFLLDEKMTVMAASRSDQIGGSIDQSIADELTKLTVGAADGGNVVMLKSFTVGTRTLPPSVVAVHEVNVLDKHWYVVTTTPLSDVDGVVNPLFRQSLFWAIFVAVSMTAILLSTAIQLIRSRVRAERERHAILEKEVRQAREIQLHWLPRPRANDGILDIATINQPASRISGDFYNWFDLPDGRTAVVIGDVTGHGMAAAFLMATTQLLVRNTLPLSEDPGRCLEEINRQLCTQVFNGQFVTIQILVLDPPTGRVEISTAGHPGPLMGSGESFQRLRLEPNLVLGVDKTATYPTEIFQLAPMATLLLYTDGVVDVESAKGTRFGTERLQQSLYGQSGGAEHAIHAVLKQIDAFRGRIPLGDDLTMVAIQLQQTLATKHTHVAAQAAESQPASATA
jgi:serine phosphatase RsbU (regulator of sigma subunit)